jgi:hypothetical protein
MITTEYILELYKRYASDLEIVRRQQYWFQLWHDNTFVRRLYRFVYGPLGIHRQKFQPMLQELEGEITYLLIRDRRPKDAIEMSPNTGWSTMWILSALRDNRNDARLRSYDIHDTSTRYVPGSLANGRWRFIQGDCKQTLSDVGHADYLFIDSDHSQEFANWYTGALLAHVNLGPWSAFTMCF